MSDTLHAAFVEQAVKNPDAPAVYSDAGVLTYDELNERSRALAERLVADGAGPGVPVGICVERTPDLVVGILAILRTGACYLPLDPNYPSERLAFMVRDSGTRMLLTTPASRAGCPAGPTVVVLGETVTTEPGERPVPVVPDDTAYIIYTSGSTGRPKGVALHHPGCVAMLAEMDRLFEGRDLSGVSAASSVCFDMSVMEIFAALCRGGAVVLVESAVHLPDSRYADRITHLNVVPSVMNSLLDAGSLPPNVRTVVFGGEPCGASSWTGPTGRPAPIASTTRTAPPRGPCSARSSWCPRTRAMSPPSARRRPASAPTCSTRTCGSCRPA